MLWHDHNEEDSAAMLVQGTSPTSSAQPFRCSGVISRGPERGRGEELILTGDQQMNILSQHSQHLRRHLAAETEPGQGGDCAVQRGDTFGRGKDETSLKPRRHVPPPPCAPGAGSWSGSYRPAGPAERGPRGRRAAAHLLPASAPSRCGR